ncbi:MAG: flagellar biosynthesis protein FlhA [Chloroflexi bacterium]|nr:MAG: flagellar biosynthesis protein FlhA [Chloroflexota bacterium]MBL1194819.1 flagellar biosynthesis protein FlhA [Chloroflexota bacterium]NOH12110.1 flagellar biosynthesis protein FlhA [Chloroflexota bacterium]
MTTATQETSAIGLRKLFSSQDAVMALAVVVILGMMLVPLPPFGIDLLVAFNLAIALAVMLITMYVRRAMDFAAFPTVLLLITLFRLGINVASSRLILLNGNAGKVIDTFGNLIVGGNYIVGVVVFLILMVIQWVVINSGAGRVAEVGARFTLDAMPGKQLAIDADLNAGIIDEQEAKLRRREIQIEADFYGAMDGASKFVKGDAIAALIIILVNVIGGFGIGVIQRNLDFLGALQSYTLLTVGAGLAIQIPALLVSASAGLIVTRSSSDASLGNDLSKQLANVNVLVGGAIIISLVALIPGIPKLPFLLVGGLFGGAGYFVWQGEQQPVETVTEDFLPISKEPETPEDMLPMVVVDPLELEVGYGLIPLIEDGTEENLLQRISGIRRQIMREMGLILPIVRVRDNLQLQPQTYRIKVRGEEVARSTIKLGHYLAIPGSGIEETLQGEKTTEPAFGLPAIWIRDADKGRAEMMGYTVVSPIAAISTHLSEVVRGYGGDILSRQMLSEMIEQLKLSTPAAIDGLIPDVLTLGEVQAVLRNLLRERVPIRDLGGILEILANTASVTRDPNILAEAVRQNMARTLSNQYSDPDGDLHVFTLAPQLEDVLKSALASNENGEIAFSVDAQTAQGILTRLGLQMEEMAKQGFPPVILVPRELRLALRRLVEKSLPSLVVLAFSEISSQTKVIAHGAVEPLGV